jgi:hypothetical protein
MLQTFTPYLILVATWTAKFGASQNSMIALSCVVFIAVALLQHIVVSVTIKFAKYFVPGILLTAVVIYWDEIVVQLFPSQLKTP